jgi:signal transduction histidine kinase
VAVLSLPQSRFASSRPRRLIAALRLESLPDDARRVEGVLAPSRVVVVLFCVMAIAVQPPSPSRYAALASALVIAYLFQSLGLWLLVRAKGVPSGLPLGVTLLDLAWAASISLVTGGPNSPFFGLYVFTILSAAYRWGLRATVTTAILAVTALLGQVLLVTFGGSAGASLLRGPVEFDLVITRCAYVLIGALLLGYMAQTEKDLRAETAAIARVIVKVQADVGLSGTLEEVSRELLSLFGAERLLLVMHGVRSRRLFVWEAEPGLEPRELSVRSGELEPEQRETYLFPAPSEAWAAVRHGSVVQVTAIDGDGRSLRRQVWPLPPRFVERCPFRSVLAMSLTFREEWEDRVFLFDPAKAASREVRLLQAFVRQAGPTIYNVYLLGRLRARVRTVERARVARDLHDGVIQSLIGLEMEVDALRRETGPAPTRVGTRLGEVQQVLRTEVAGLRELMLRMKPLYLDPHRLPEYLVDLVDRFQRETGIAAHFSCELDEVALRPRVCTELARIVQEALANVRKHSGAQNVLVRFDATDEQWKLSVDDDGSGFRFSGRLTLAELDAGRLGPMVIKERVRSIGGQLTIDSKPGGGSRLEITLPRVAGA